MIARSISESESEEFFETLCRSFDLDIFLSRPIFRQDPFYDLNFKRALFDDTGKMVSVLTLVPLSIRLAGDQIAAIAGIASVGTPPESRSNGYAGRLIEETLKSLHRDRLFPIAALETQNQDFYRRFGFEGCSEISAWEASLEDFAIRPSIGLPRIISRSEMMAKIDSFQRAYDRSISNRQGVFLRDLRRWEAIFSFRSNFVTAICENGSEIMGYLILTPPDETGSIEILEAVAENQMVMGFLFQMIENYPGALSARGRINRTGLKDFRIDRMVSAQWDEIPGFMCALADPLEALSVIARGTQASGAISDLKQGLVVRLREGSNDICIKIKHCCHGAHVAQIDGDGGDGDWFETDRHGLIQLVMGCKSPQELAQAGKLKASDSHSLEAASRLFPKIDPFLAPLDSF